VKRIYSVVGDNLNGITDVRRDGSLSASSAAPQPGSEGNKALPFQRVDVRTHLRTRNP
jgi:hypothetical protein